MGEWFFGIEAFTIVKESQNLSLHNLINIWKEQKQDILKDINEIYCTMSIHK